MTAFFATVVLSTQPRVPLSGRGQRCGAILLIVLSLLSFFLVAGTFMLVSASRTRLHARAVSNASSEAGSKVLGKELLQNALAALIRGPLPVVNGLPPGSRESLLEDKFGPTALSVTISATSVKPITVSGSSFRPVLEAVATSTAQPLSQQAIALNGRLLTLTPTEPDGVISTFRILRAVPDTNGAVRLYLDNSGGAPSSSLPQKQCRGVINGREFTPRAELHDLPESYDAFDAANKNLWLAKQVIDPNGRVTEVLPSFRKPGDLAAIAECDNDGDGVPDGVWLQNVLPDRPSPNGGTIRCEVSYLVTDLQGRLNVNTHGSAATMLTGSMQWLPPDRPETIPVKVPTGIGYGPAEVDMAIEFPASPSSAEGDYPREANTPDVDSPRPVSPTWATIVRSGSLPQVSPIPNSADERRIPPSLNPMLGCWGSDLVPGKTNANSQDWFAPLLASSPNTVIDIGGRYKVFTRSSTASPVPELMHFSVTTAPTFDDAAPYRLRLGKRFARGRSVLDTGPADTQSTPSALEPLLRLRDPAGNVLNTVPADAPFSPAELEPLLRLYDDDATQLPPRLVAALQDQADAKRWLLTTDSWTSQALSGLAATKVLDFMQAGTNIVGFQGTVLENALGLTGPYSVMSPDISAGLRFDINRPLEFTDPSLGGMADKLKQEYCKHLYTLALAIDPIEPGETAKERCDRIAQWVVNVVDFRDADSQSTCFLYDTSLTDGWQVDESDPNQPCKYGVERPEVLITQTAAWTDGKDSQLFVMLYNPWKTSVQIGSGAPQATELPDPVFRHATQPGIDLSKINPANSPVWRLRIDKKAIAIPPDTVIPPGGYVCLHTTNPQRFTIDTSSGVVAAKDAGASFVVPNGTGTEITLERLADPTKKAPPDDLNSNEDNGNNRPSNKQFTQYLTVDRASITVINVAGAAAPQLEIKHRAESMFWKQVWSKEEALTLGPHPAGIAKRLHWPNRPFVSTAELAFVPKAGPGDFLRNYADPETTTPGSFSLATRAGSHLLDAVRVSSPFASTSRLVGNKVLLDLIATQFGIADLRLPEAREPGRINVNTITHPRVWPVLVNDGGQPAKSANPFTTGTNSTPADSLTKLVLTKPILSPDGAPDQPPNAPLSPAPEAMSPFLSAQGRVMTRMANMATIHSNVFAVWITIKVTDTSPRAAPPSYHRMFAILDRSLPVGFSPGEDLNSAEIVVLKRMLD